MISRWVDSCLCMIETVNYQRSLQSSLDDAFDVAVWWCRFESAGLDFFSRLVGVGFWMWLIAALLVLVGYGLKWGRS